MILEEGKLTFVETLEPLEEIVADQPSKHRVPQKLQALVIQWTLIHYGIARFVRA